MNELDFSLFGDVLVKPSTGEEAIPEDVLTDKVILLYFGAHWQPACNKFTTKLNFFNQMVDNVEDFEIVFCSMDRSQEEYTEYSEKMTWWCLPYAISTLPLLAAKYRAHGLPHLVVIDSDLKLITREGVDTLSKDPLGNNFPWRPTPIVKLLPEYYLTDDEVGEALIPMEELDEKYIMLYFSASHCEMSQEFTPWLLKAYKILKGKRDDFELLFVSGDKDEAGFYKFRTDTKFAAIPYEETKARKLLAERLDVTSYPMLLMLGPKPADDDTDNLTGGDRPIINSEVQAVIENGDYLTDFPYYPKPFGDLCKTTDDINTHKCLIVFHEMADEEEQYEIEDAITDAAQEYRDDEIIKFYWAFDQEAPLAMNIRQACRLGNVEAQPTMVLLDIPNDGAFYVSDEVDITMETILAFLVTKGPRKQI